MSNKRIASLTLFLVLSVTFTAFAQDEIEDLLSQELLEGRMQSGDTMIIDVEGDKFVVSTKEVPALP